LNEKAQENHLLAAREKDLLSHIQQLEAQMQKLIQVGYFLLRATLQSISR
jgi:hypothetical protein